MELKKIESFKVDHRILSPGIYLSRKDEDIDTWDLRFKKPNSGNLLDNAAMHTIEHLAATYFRSSNHADNIIYFGPMGCRTGFYLLTKRIDENSLIEMVKKCFIFIGAYNGDIPGVSEEECGNYLEHNLNMAKKESALFSLIISNWRNRNLNYNAADLRISSDM